jgi:outer membrane protein assembly factor BamB
MNRRTFLAACPAFALASCSRAEHANVEGSGAPDKLEVGATDWPWWRGPTRDGTAPEQKLPLEWDAKKNVLWEAPVPGRGHGSVCAVGDKLFLCTADEKEQTQGVLCLERATGKQLWHTEVHKGNFMKGSNTKSSHASATPACDGKHVFVNFANDNAIVATALTLDGKQAWRTKVCAYTLHQGYGASPAVYGSLVLVAGDNKGGGAVSGLDRATGKVVWSRARPKQPNYCSPIVLNANGKDQLFLIGCDLVTSLDPLTGKENWELKGATTECVTSTVTDGKHIYTSGGYPKNHVSAVKVDGSGVAWENKSRVYVPSMLYRDGHLYAVLDAGTAMCWKSDTGAKVWEGALNGTFSSSPVMVGDHIFATNEVGRTFVFKATPKEFDQVADNKLGDECFATPTPAGGKFFARVAVKTAGARQEKVVCIG